MKSIEDRTVDVAAFIDGLGISRFQAKLILVSCLVTFFDGLDFALISYTAPYIRDEMNPSQSMYGLILSGSVIGQMIGSLTCAYLADRYGRRPVILWCTFFGAIATFLTGISTTPEQVFVWRLLCGLMIGGLLPVIWALNIESVPKARRATVVAVIMFGFSIGAATAAPLTNLIAAADGPIGPLAATWHSVHFVAGGLTLIVALALIALLPESLRFLVAIQASKTRIERLLVQFDPGFVRVGETEYVVGDERKIDKERGMAKDFAKSLRELFKGGLAGITLLIWTAYLFSSVGLYLKNQLGPTFLEELGVAREMAAWIGAATGIGGAIAGMLLLYFTEKRGPAWVALFPALATPVLFCIGSGLLLGSAFLPAIVVASILIGGGHAAVISIIGIYYPSAIRSNAGGWTSFVAKFGGAMAPLVGAQFLGSADQVLRSYLLAGACTLAIAVAVTLLAPFARRLNQQPTVTT